jgi:transcriptional regulator with XRE-family HTH domain
VNQRELKESRRRLCTALREAREAAGLTQTDLAKRLGVGQSYVSKIENGDRRIEVAELVLVCRALDIDPVKFIKAIIAAEK